MKLNLCISVALNPLEYDNKYCLLKEESLLPLPQPLRLTLPVGTF